MAPADLSEPSDFTPKSPGFTPYSLFKVKKVHKSVGVGRGSIRISQGVCPKKVDRWGSTGTEVQKY